MLKLAALADKGNERLEGKLNKKALRLKDEAKGRLDNAKLALTAALNKDKEARVLKEGTKLLKGKEDKVESRLGSKLLVDRLDNTALLDKGKLLKGKEIALNDNGIALLLEGKLLANDDSAGSNKELLNLSLIHI